MRRTRLRRKIDLGNGVSASPPVIVSNTGTPQNNTTPRRSIRTPSLVSLPDTPTYVDSPNRTLNETFSPEPEEKVFSIQTLVDSIKKSKRHTSSAVIETNVYDTPRVTRASLNLAKKSITSIKKPAKESPIFANLSKIVSQSPKITFGETVGQVAEVVAGTNKVIKSIRKKRRSSGIKETITSVKKNVKFHSPANMEMSTFDIDVKMQSDRKVLRSSRSISTASKPTPEKVEKTKTPGSRRKMPNFTEIHQRQFEKMESITEHAARKAERAKSLTRSPKVISKIEITSVEPTVEPEIISNGIVNESKPNGCHELEVVEVETDLGVQELEPIQEPPVQEPVVIKNDPAVVLEEPSVITQDPVAILNNGPAEVLEEPSVITQNLKPMLFHELEPYEMEELDKIEIPSGSTSISSSPVIKNPFEIEQSSVELSISPSHLSPLIEIEQRRASSLIGRSPFAVEMQESFSIPPKVVTSNKRPIAISRIPSKINTINKNITKPVVSRPAKSKPDLNATVTRIPQPKLNLSVLSAPNKTNPASNLNSSNVFVFKANKTVVETKPAQNTTKLKRTQSMMSAKPRTPISIRPTKENQVDKVKERQQKNISMYKGRPDPNVKSRTSAPKNVITVRTNKRFELQMKFRKMNNNN